MFFYLVTNGWIFDIGLLLCDNSINQSINALRKLQQVVLIGNLARLNATPAMLSGKNENTITSDPVSSNLDGVIFRRGKRDKNYFTVVYT